MDYKVDIVNDEEQALRHILTLQKESYPLSQIYVLTMDAQKAEELAEISGTQRAAAADEGLSDSLANLYLSQGERLLEEMEAIGLSEYEAQQYEQALEFGGYMIVAKLKLESAPYMSAEQVHPNEIWNPQSGYNE
ncbi:general stress protein [Paenibacillus eucommiae]|uniref:General stress protein 17M-like domain-containing protein n=1 Tax=Paenibacillus eucommiae TaxID=1355755 RepID=A0ABS4IN39_9BACL|nr:general stress protein [Paenibacillus eucommiae]MBP1988980.1 hypothetical protein [Paenibacillus eucommiae]